MDRNDAVSSRPSSYFIEDGSFFRIKNVQLTYSFNQNVLESIGGIASAQIYIQGQNLVTFTKYTGLNPEVQLSNTDDSRRNLTLGYDGGGLPVARTFNLGLSVTLK